MILSSPLHQKTFSSMYLVSMDHRVCYPFFLVIWSWDLIFTLCLAITLYNRTCDRLGISYKIPTSADGNKAMQDAEDGVAYEIKGHVDTYLNNDSIMSIDDDGNKVNKEKVIFQISVNLQKTALTLMDNFANDEGTSINYKSMRRSAEFREYVNIASQLRQVSLSAIGAMSEKKRLSFFANLYNSLILHATCVLGAPENTPQGRSAFFSGESYVYVRSK